MYEDNLKEWLEGYIDLASGSRGEGNKLRMTRGQYFKMYFPKEYDYKPEWEQLQKVKKELRENDVIRNYCSDHNKYFRLNESCPNCK